MAISIGLVALGVVLLAWAADNFVIGAARVAVLLSVSPMLIGVVIVGFGTSAPEILVSSLAAFQGDPEVAVGNVVGSNLANLTVLLGVAAVMTPLIIESSTVWREAPIAAVSMMLYAVLVRGGLSRPEGIVLLAAMAVALWWVLRASTSGDELGREAGELAGEDGSLLIEGSRTLLGLMGTVVGAQALLRGALDLADRAGVDDGVVGLTLVAIGTSLPELVTVVQSARHGEHDLIIGNLLGSSMFNALAVGGVATMVRPAVLADTPLVDTAPWLAAGVGLAVWAMMGTQRRIARREGFALVAAYALVFPLVASM
jgi:cation:H+ antiporter